MHPILPWKLFQRGEFRDYDKDRKRHALYIIGITAVVNLYGKKDLDMDELVAKHVHHPIADGVSVDAAPLLRIATEMAMHICGGGRVLTVCHAGRNRSGLMSALIVRELHACSGLEALAIVRAGRPRAVANKVFEDFLGSLKPKLEGGIHA